MRTLLSFILLSFYYFSFAQSPDIEWSKTFGGSGYEVCNSIIQTIDGGYVVSGHTNSIDGDVLGQHGNRDIWIVKISAIGMIQWQKTFGGSSDDFALSTQQTKEGGYIVVGNTFSTDGDVLNSHGSLDIFIVKLNTSGAIEWIKSIGGTLGEQAYSLKQTKDDGYIIVGNTSSNDGDIIHNNGERDIWVIKLSSSGQIEWQKTFGGTTSDYGKSIVQTSDGGYIVGGTTLSSDGDITGNHGESDIWIGKLSSNGDLLWQKSLGGSSADQIWSIKQTEDMGFVVAGTTSSFDGDISFGHGNKDFWVVKLSTTGSVIWEKSYGGSSEDILLFMKQTKDKGFLIAGSSESNDGEVSNNLGGVNYWIVKLSSSGNISWEKTLVGYSTDGLNTILETNDNCYLLAGTIESTKYNLSGAQGGFDIWMVKLSLNGSIIWQKVLGGKSLDYIGSVQQTNDDGFIVGGSTESNDGNIDGNNGNRDFWVVKLLPDPPSIVCPQDTLVNGCSFSNITYNVGIINTDLIGYTFSGATTGSGSGTGSGSTFEPGVTSIEVVAYNNSGGPKNDTCSFSITIMDSIPPFIDCVYDTIVYLNSEGKALMTKELILDTVYDNCSYSLSFSHDYLTCADIDKTIEVEVYAEDGSNNIAHCDAFVKVLDYFDPRIVCTPTTITLKDSGEYMLTLDDKVKLVSNSWDNCLDSIQLGNYTFENIVFNCEDIDTGLKQVFVSAIDNNGNSAVAYCSIEIIDETKPVAVCNDSINVVLDDKGQAMISPLLLNNILYTEGLPSWAQTYNGAIGGSYDACSIMKLELSKETFNCDDIGYSNIELIISDPHGNIASCTSIVNVIDENAPVLNLISNISIVVEPGICETKINYPEINAVDECSDIKYARIRGLGSSSLFPLGETIETWTATDESGNNDTTSFSVVITTFNDQPGSNSINDLIINEDQEEVIQNVNGLNYGKDCGYQNIIKVEVQTENKELFSIIDLDYNLGDESASIKLKPFKNRNGSALFSLIIQDDGGSDRGGLDTIIKTFSVHVNPINDSPFVANLIEDHEIKAGDTINIEINSELGDIFDDIDNESLSISVKMDDDSPLPDWGVFSEEVLTVIPTLKDTGCYKIKVSAFDTGGLSTYFSFEICILDWTTSIGNYTNNIEVNLFPNPTNDLVNMNVKGITQNNINIQVTTLSGKEVINKEFQLTDLIQLDMSSFASGIYFVKVISKEKHIVKKLILNKNN